MTCLSVSRRFLSVKPLRPEELQITPSCTILPFSCTRKFSLGLGVENYCKVGEWCDNLAPCFKRKWIVTGSYSIVWSAHYFEMSSHFKISFRWKSTSLHSHEIIWSWTQKKIYQMPHQCFHRPITVPHPPSFNLQFVIFCSLLLLPQWPPKPVQVLLASSDATFPLLKWLIKSQSDCFFFENSFPFNSISIASKMHLWRSRAKAEHKFTLFCQFYVKSALCRVFSLVSFNPTYMWK